MTRLSRFLLTLPLCLLVAFGCTSSRTPCTVSGKVTYKGQPVTGGTIAFHLVLEEQKGSIGDSIKPDGTYQVNGLKAGEYTVTIETESINKDRPQMSYGGGKNKDAQAQYRKKQQEMGKAPGITESMGTYVKIPPKYGDPAKSGLKVKLINGKNDFNPDLNDN